MKLDPYQQCLCGSGKKIKFCSCKLNLHEAEKILRLIDGEQYVAALDRINRLLKKTPNAAWLLALKADLAGRMADWDVYRQTIDRFLQLQPTNPLALAFKAHAELLGPVDLQKVARLVCDSMAEKAGFHSRLIVPVVEEVVHLLRLAGKEAMIAPWEALRFNLLESERDSVSRSFLNDSEINLLAKSDFPEIEVPGDAPYRDRFEEAATLIAGNRFAQAATKLQALLRDFPDELAPRIELLRVQRFLLDEEGMRATIRRLVKHPGLSDEQRAYYRGVELLIDTRKTLRVSGDEKAFKVPDPSAFLQRCEAIRWLDMLSHESTREYQRQIQAAVGEEVPPSHLFAIRLPQQEDEAASADSPSGYSIGNIGFVAFWGKQVDKPARAFFGCTRVPKMGLVLDALLSELPLGSEIPVPEAARPAFQWHLPQFLMRPRKAGPTPIALPANQFSKAIAEEYPDVPLDALDGKTLREVATTEDGRIEAFAWLMWLEGAQLIPVMQQDMQRLYDTLGIERPVVSKIESFSTVGTKILEIDRIDVTTVDDEQFRNLVMYAVGVGATRTLFRLAEQAGQRESIMEDPRLRYILLSVLGDWNESEDDQLRALEQLEKTAVELGKSPGPSIIQQVGIFARQGRAKEAAERLNRAVSQYPDDEYLMRWVAMLASEYEKSAPNVRASGKENVQPDTAPAATARPSGLVIPGEGAPEDSTGSKPGGSGLWLPGQ